MTEERRELTKEEQDIYQKQKQRFEEGLSFFKEELEIIIYKQHIIAPHEYHKELENLKQEAKVNSIQIKELENKLKIINEHLANGVLIKKQEEK